MTPTPQARGYGQAGPQDGGCGEPVQSAETRNRWLGATDMCAAKLRLQFILGSEDRLLQLEGRHSPFQSATASGQPFSVWGYCGKPHLSQGTSRRASAASCPLAYRPTRPRRRPAEAAELPIFSLLDMPLTSYDPMSDAAGTKERAGAGARLAGWVELRGARVRVRLVSTGGTVADDVGDAIGEEVQENRLLLHPASTAAVASPVASPRCTPLSPPR